MDCDHTTAKVVLSIPHSMLEKSVFFFLVIHKIKREDRKFTDGRHTLFFDYTVKLNLPESKAHPCYEFGFNLL